ncbi:unnamed protein product, partial [Mesorhabditis belari]
GIIILGFVIFDKMREDDRVAIHEAMEQQTISIAKAGITTTLNSRCSVLAAANSVFGRWDDSRGSENIDFLPTILSRFDMIYIVKDAHDMSKDAILAKHVIEVHVHAANSQTDTLNLDGVAISDKMEVMDKDGYLTLDFLKKYVSFARQNCGPRLTDTASNKLVNHYIRMRNPTPEENTGQKLMKDKPSAIPITVRQLEAIIRISEMELAPLASERHIDEALRLFRVSTMEAAATGNLSGIEGFTSDEDQEAISRIEKQLKKRFAVGTHVSEHLIVQDFVQRQHYRESLVKKVINALIRRGDLQQKMQRKMLYRVR